MRPLTVYLRSLLFFFHDTSPTEIYTLSLHDALPIFPGRAPGARPRAMRPPVARTCTQRGGRRSGRFLGTGVRRDPDRKSTRLNSSHEWISYAVFCLKKKKKKIRTMRSNKRQSTTTAD